MLWIWSLAFAGSPEVALERVADRPIPDDVALRADVVSWVGGDRVWVRPTWRGLPVEGRDQLVILDHRGDVRSLRERDLQLSLDPTPAVPRADAITRVDRDLRNLGTGQLWPARAELVVWARDEARLAWAVDASVADPVQTWRVYVDAHTGEVIAGESTGAYARGRVYPENPKNSELVEVELHGLEGEGLVGEYATAWSCAEWEIFDGLLGASGACERRAPQAIPNADGDYLFAPAPGASSDPLAEVHVYHHTDVIARVMDERYGLDLGSMDVHVNFSMANAFYGDFNGDGMPDLSFGNSPDGVDFGYDADVVYHEFGHAIIDNISNVGGASGDAYGMEWAGGSLNEGSADVFAMLLTGDPSMAEYAGSSYGRTTAIRELAADRRCPEDLHGQVHWDGEIWGAYFWNLIEDPAVEHDAVFDLLYGAASTWDFDISWAKAGASIEEAAAAMLDAQAIDQDTHDAILAHLEPTGIADCGRVVDLETVGETDQLLYNLGLFEPFDWIPLSVQFSLTVPDDHDTVRLNIVGPGDDRLGWTVFVREGAPVEHEPLSIDALGVGSARPTVYDLAVDGAGDEWVMELDANSDLSIQPGQTYYFAVAGRNLGEIELFEIVDDWITVSGRTSGARVLVTGGGEEPAGACSTGGATPWLLLAGAGLLARRRRS